MRSLTILFVSVLRLSAGFTSMVGASNEQCRSDDKQCRGAHPHERDFYINGAWVAPLEGATPLEVMDPSTGKPVSTISIGTNDDVDAAVAAARHALGSWSQLSVEERIPYVKKLLKLYKQRREDMAKYISMEMGAPIEFALDTQVSAGSYHIKSFLDAMEHFEVERTIEGVDPEDALTTIFYEPIGVVALITPWNWPMNQITLKVIPALLVGCTCVLKPSEIAPLSGLLFAELIHEAGFPPGVFNLLNGDGPGVGTRMSTHEHIDMVSFTGSTRAGALVSKNAADTFKRVSLELGGKGANIIFADVGTKFKNSVKDGVWNCFGNSGQSCNAPTRMLVEASKYEEAVAIAKETAEEELVKSAHEEGDHMGPVVSQAQWDRIQDFIRIGIEEGARLVAGGLGHPEGVDPNGYYVKPTVFADVTNNMRIAQEEIFGPVLSILSFETEEEAIEIANDSPYGLTNYVQSSDGARLRRVARALKSGMVEMNGADGDDGSPFGGYKASGNGREGGTFGLEEFCEVKAVSGLID